MTTQATSALAMIVKIGANAIAELQTVRLKLDNREIDVTSVDSAGWKEILAGINSWEITVEANSVPTDTAQAAIRTAALTPASNTVAVTFLPIGGSAPSWAGNARAVMDLSSQLTEGQKFTATLRGNGALTYTAA